MELIALVLALVILVMPAAALVVALVALNRARRLRAEVGAMAVEAETLALRLRRLESGAVKPSSAAEAVAEPPPPAVEPEVAYPPDVAPGPELPVEVSPPSKESPPVPRPPVVEAPPASAEEAPRPQPVEPEVEVPPQPPRPPAAEPSPPGPPPAGPPRPRRSFDWENLVGVKLFSWVAGVALFVAAVSFLRYSVQHGWLTPPIQMALGLLTGLVLLVVCELKVARRYPVTANAMDGAAIAVLYATFFTAHVRWHLVGSIATGAFMVLVTAVAVLLAVRRDAVFIALLGLVGGFATPLVLSTGVDRPVGLFGYLLLLNAGLAWVAYTRRWPLLTALSLALTALHQWVWVARFLDSSKLPLSLGIFLVFPALAFAALAIGERRLRAGGPPGRLSSVFHHSANLGAVVPIAFALYLAAVPAYGEHWELLLGLVLLVDLGLAAVAVWRGPALLHLAAGWSSVLVLAVWLAVSYDGSAWPGALVFVAAMVLVYLLTPVVARRLGRPLEGLAAHADLTAPLLLLAFPVLLAIEPACADPALPFAALFVLAALVAGFAMASRRGLLHFVACFFAVAAEAVWSARHLEPERLEAGLLVYVAFALLYLGVPVAARRLGRPLQPAGGAALLLLASVGLLFFLTTGVVAEAALWGLALLLVVLNAGLLVEGASGRVPLLSAAGLLLSWVVLARWWAVAPLVGRLVPALAVVAGLGVVAVAGSLLAALRARSAGRPTAALGGGMYLGLVGHAFLLFVAARSDLAIPPWPLLGVLAVLDLAAAVAALAARRGALLGAAVVASAPVLMVLEITAGAAPWPGVATLAAVGVAVLAVVFLALSRRVVPVAAGRERDVFAATVAVAMLLAQGVAILASARPGAPGFSFLLVTQGALTAGLLVLAGWRGWHGLAVVAATPPFAAVAVWASEVHPAWHQRLVFAAVPYLLLVLYPVLLGRRARDSRLPWVAAVVASALAFLVARPAIVAGGHGDVIGLLPVVQGAILAGLLGWLLRLEPAAERDRGRLALVAGAALAFVTVAVPLQVDRQWITVGWALEGAALAWLFGRIRHRGLLWTAVGLLVVVFVRLTLNPAVLAYHPRGDLPILNWYLYTYLVSAGAMFVAAAYLNRADAVLGPRLPRPAQVLPVLGTVLLFLLLNIEIADFFATGPTLTFRWSGASLAQDLSYTLGWALFAIGLLVAGVAAGSRAARAASVALLLVTALKAFLHDLARLGGLYRVASFVGLAACLALVALALQRFVLARDRRGGERE